MGEAPPMGTFLNPEKMSSLVFLLERGDDRLDLGGGLTVRGHARTWDIAADQVLGSSCGNSSCQAVPLDLRWPTPPRSLKDLTTILRGQLLLVARVGDHEICVRVVDPAVCGRERTSHGGRTAAQGRRRRRCAGARTDPRSAPRRAQLKMATASEGSDLPLEGVRSCVHDV